MNRNPLHASRTASLTTSTGQPTGFNRPISQRSQKCTRRYSSFRRSDGTYQPFNRPTREVCPLLR